MGRVQRECGVWWCDLEREIDHITLERQIRIMQAPRADHHVADAVGPGERHRHRLQRLDEALLTHVLAPRVIGLDQTGWPRLDGSGGKKWQMWCLIAPGVVTHPLRDDKSAVTFKGHVRSYHGTTVCNDLGTHEAGPREGPGIVLANCWAYLYRRSEEAQPDHPEAEKALAWIGALYEFDRHAERDLGRLAELRRTDSVRVLDELKEWALVDAHADLAVHRQSGRVHARQPLTRFVEDARIPPDNDATERTIRGPVVGCHNHFGSKSRRGTEVAATLDTVIETAKLHDIEPAAYLYAAIAAVDHGERLLPK